MITIAYPIASPTTSVSLRGPNFQDVWREAQAAVFNSNMGGELVVTDAGKPKIKTLEYTFHGLTKTVADALIALVRSAIGQKVLVTDYLSNEFACYISNEDMEVITLHDTCNYDIRIQFLIPVS
jgi:nitrous oxidase accessory protein NosD